MIEHDIDSHRGTGRFVLRPQRSATWQQNLLLVAAVAVAALPVAVGWTLVGFWPILPWCGFELGLLTFGLYCVSRSLLAREVVIVGTDEIVIEAGHRDLERRFRLGRAWASVILQPARRPRYPSRLLVRSHGRAVEFGRFLTDDERRALAADLAGLVARRPYRLPDNGPVPS